MRKNRRVISIRRESRKVLWGMWVGIRPVVVWTYQKKCCNEGVVRVWRCNCVVGVCMWILVVLFGGASIFAPLRFLWPVYLDLCLRCRGIVKGRDKSDVCGGCLRILRAIRWMMYVFALVLFPPLRHASVGNAGLAREFCYCCVLMILALMWADVWVWVSCKRDGRYRSSKNGQ